MNTAEDKSISVGPALGHAVLCYAPLFDKRRIATGMRLTLASSPGHQTHPVIGLLDDLNRAWPEYEPPILIGLLDTAIEASVKEWRPPGNAILEIPAVQLAEAGLQAVVRTLCSDGKRLALRGLPAAPIPDGLASCFEYVVLDAREAQQVSQDSLSAASLRGTTGRIRWIATGMRGMAEADGALQRGAVATVGWPIDGSARRYGDPLQAGQATVLELLRLVRADAPVERVEEVLKHDTAIAFKLLRLVNSAAFGLRVEITSFRHAVLMLGYKKLLRWLSLLLATASKDANMLPLMHASIRRGMFLEAIGGTPDDAEQRDELFITGAFSLLDRLTQTGFEKLFELIALPEDVIEAIRDRQGPYAPYLSLVESIERADHKGVIDQLEYLAIPFSDCNAALLGALRSASLLDGDLLSSAA